MATPSTATPNLSQTSLSGMAGGMGTTTTNLETVGDGAPSTTASLPIASGVTVNSPPVSRPTQVAYLTLPDTTVTAIAVPGTTGLAVLQGSGETLTFRAEGVTLSDGNVVSLGFDGLVESTTTAMYEPLTGVSAASSFGSSRGGAGDFTPSYPLPTGPGPVLINSTFPFLTAATPSTSGDTELTVEQTSAGTLITMSSSGSGNTTATSGTPGGGSAGGSESGTSATQSSASPSGSQDAAATLSAGRAAMLLGAVGGLAAWGL